MITRENYEIYFMEYMDGNLSAREQAEVEAFLLVHTDLWELLDGMDEVRLDVPAEVFGKKEEIKRTVREREIEYYAIAAAEGVITDEEQAWVDGNVDKDVFEREVETCAKIKVKPNPKCRFEGKAGVYRKSGAVLFVKRYAAIAAVVALGIVVAIYSTKKEEFSMEDLPVTVVKTETILLPGVPEPEAIVEEIKALVADGVTEVMLLGQNVNSYGKTLEHPVTFAQLLKQVEAIEGLKRIRFMTSHPKDLSDELIRTMAESKKVCHHLHLPMQSGSSRILKIMNRRYDKEKYLELVSKIRKAVPDISLTTDIIVGFPGETEEDFQDTLDVVEKCDFDSAFTFIYSKRSGTPAAKMENQVPEDVVKDRFDRLLALVQEKGRKASSRFEGTVQEILVEEESKEKGIFTGRTEYNLLVHFPGCQDLIGKYVKVKLDTCKGFYYFGTLVD